MIFTEFRGGVGLDPLKALGNVEREGGLLVRKFKSEIRTLYNMGCGKV
jgi:hypothetical protein